MKRIYGIILAASALALGGFYAWNSFFAPVPRDPDELVQTAISGAELSERVDAAATLSGITQPDPTPLLRHVAENTNDPEVLIQAMNGLAARGDAVSLPLFVAGLQHASSAVRASAWAAVQRIYGPAVENLKYNVDGPPEERAKVARTIKKMYDAPASSKA